MIDSSRRSHRADLVLRPGKKQTAPSHQQFGSSLNQVRSSSSTLRVAFVLAFVTFVAISSYFALQQAGLLKQLSRASMTHAAKSASQLGAVTPGSQGSRAVRVGALEFPYAVEWRPAPQSDLPATVHGSAGTRVIAGLCTAATPAKAKGASCGVGMTYLLFGEGREFPALADLDTTFDAGFARSFPHFSLVSSERLVSEGEVPYLRYEFTFIRNHVSFREIVAAYSTRRQGIITISSGPDASIIARRKQIDKVSAAARLA